MTTTRKSPGPATARFPQAGSVDQFLAALDHPNQPAAVALRQLILGLDPRIREEIKWNAPSFFIVDHFATFKLRPADTVQVILHTGAKVRATPTPLSIDDPDKLLRWVAADRCVATFQSLADVEAKRAAFSALVCAWIAQL